MIRTEKNLCPDKVYWQQTVNEPISNMSGGSKWHKNTRTEKRTRENVEGEGNILSRIVRKSFILYITERDKFRGS